MNKKLTMISIRFRGRLHTFFVMARVESGKAAVDSGVYERLLDHLGVRRGDTYSFS